MLRLVAVAVFLGVLLCTSCTAADVESPLTVLQLAESVEEPDARSATPPVSVIRSYRASWYSTGRVTAQGRRYDPDGMTAAHRTLPFGTRVRVTDPSSGRSVHVVINDRGPYVAGRQLDLSRGAARRLGIIDRGVANVLVEVAEARD
jgi:rare lipoprotein A